MSFLKRRIFFVILVLLLVGVILLPDDFPFVVGIDRIAWEMMSVVRYYAGRCTPHNPWFVVFPETHFVPDIIWSITYNLPILSSLPPWKQILMVNLLFLWGSSLLIFLLVTEYGLKERVAIFHSLLLFFQPAVFIWMFASFSYYIAGFFLLLSIYLFEKKRYFLAFLTVAFLPMIRHEYTVFLGAPILLLLSERHFSKMVLTYLIPVAYYFILPLFVWGDWRRLYFFQGELYLSSFSIGPYFQTYLYLEPFLYYFPVLWLGYFVPFLLRRSRILIFFAIVSLAIFMVPFISRVIYPVFLISLVGVGIIWIYLKGQVALPLVIVMILLSVGWSVGRSWQPENGDTLAPFCSCSSAIRWLESNGDSYDLFILPPDGYFILWDDSRCVLADKLALPYKDPRGGSGLGSLLLYNGDIVKTSKDPSFFRKHRVVTLMKKRVFDSLPQDVKGRRVVPISYDVRDGVYIVGISP